jgi:hypothetical protein
LSENELQVHVVRQTSNGFFEKEKPAQRSYNEHLNYLLQVNEAGGGHFSRNVLMSLVHRCGADLVHKISARYDCERTDYLKHATELANYADVLWNDRNIGRTAGRSKRCSAVNAVEPKRHEARTCHNCQKKGHLAFACSEKKKKNFEFKAKNRKIDKNVDESFALNVSNIGDNEEDIAKDQAHVVWPKSIEWILDSGCGRHLTGNPELFGDDTDKAGTSLLLPDRTKTRSSRKGNLEMVTQVGSEMRDIVVKDVEFVPVFNRNLLLYVSLEKKGVRLQYNNKRRYLVNKQGTKVAEVHSEGDILVYAENSGARWQMQL